MGGTRLLISIGNLPQNSWNSRPSVAQRVRMRAVFSRMMSFSWYLLQRVLSFSLGSLRRASRLPITVRNFEYVVRPVAGMVGGKENGRASGEQCVAQGIVSIASKRTMYLCNISQPATNNKASAANRNLTHSPCKHSNIMTVCEGNQSHIHDNHATTREHQKRRMARVYNCLLPTLNDHKEDN